MTEIRTAIPDEIDEYLDSMVRTGPFASKAELVRAALVSYASVAAPMPRGFDKENVFSPDGRLYQVEYARESAFRGAPAVGVVYDRGILLACRVRPPSRLARVNKIRRIGEKILACPSGLVADGHMTLRFLESHPPETFEELEDGLVNWFWAPTMDRTKRPLGVALLVGSVQTGESRLFSLDPSGSVASAPALAIGQGSKEIQTELDASYRGGTSRDAENLATRVLGKSDATGRVEVARLEPNRKGTPQR